MNPLRHPTIRGPFRIFQFSKPMISVFIIHRNEGRDTQTHAGITTQVHAAGSGDRALQSWPLTVR